MRAYKKIFRYQINKKSPQAFTRGDILQII